MLRPMSARSRILENSRVFYLLSKTVIPSEAKDLSGIPTANPSAPSEIHPPRPQLRAATSSLGTVILSLNPATLSNDSTLAR